MSSLVQDPLLRAAQADPAAPALVAGSVAWTRMQLLEAADALACALHADGIGRGQRVASLLADGWSAVVLIHALRRLGAVAVPLNRRSSAAELGYQLEVAGPVALLHDAAHAAIAHESVASLPAGRVVSAWSIEALLAGAPCQQRLDLRDEVDGDADGTVIFTSGTSGRPKGAVLTHGNQLASAEAWAAELEPRPGDRWLACLPLFHVAGLAIVTRMTCWGGELEVHDHFDAVAVLTAIDGGATHVSLVAAQLEALLRKRPGMPAPAVLRALLLGGGPIPAPLLEEATGAGWPVYTTYGMTETASGFVVGHPDQGDGEDAGQPLTNVDVRIEKPDPEDGIGTIKVRGPMVFRGYIDEDVGESIDADGWFDTGDVGSLDEAGRLRLSDRRDDLFVSGGENVYPAEIEAVLLAHPDVGDAVVLPAVDPRWGAVPVAAVVTETGVSDGDLQRHCATSLASYKVPVRFYRVAAIPRSGMGKLRRADAAAELELTP